MSDHSVRHVPGDHPGVQGGTPREVHLGVSREAYIPGCTPSTIPREAIPTMVHLRTYPERLYTTVVHLRTYPGRLYPGYTTVHTSGRLYPGYTTVHTPQGAIPGLIPRYTPKGEPSLGVKPRLFSQRWALPGCKTSLFLPKVGPPWV